MRSMEKKLDIIKLRIKEYNERDSFVSKSIMTMNDYLDKINKLKTEKPWITDE